MFNISFIQLLILLIAVFLLFGDFKLLSLNISNLKAFLSKFNKKRD